MDLADVQRTTRELTVADELHISSLLVQHRADALPVIETFVRAHRELDLAASGDCRSVLLCETGNQRAIMDQIDMLLTLDGVLNVSLIYHHAESRAELEEPVQVAPSMRGVDV